MQRNPQLCDFSLRFFLKAQCTIVLFNSRNGNSKALSDIRRLVADPGYTPTDPKELCNRIFVTLYMGTKNSSEETKNRAALLASQIGSHHMSITIDKAVSAMMEIFSEANPGWEPKFSGTRYKIAIVNKQLTFCLHFSPWRIRP